MKAIATINFKGGVGKTTITWWLAKYAAEVRGKKVLVIDTDAQMSLTLAVHLQESGAMYGDFEKWYEDSHKQKKSTLLNALDKYDLFVKRGGHFDFPIDSDLMYQMSPNLHFIPSTQELYWLEMEVIDKDHVKGFVGALLGKIQHSKKYSYDYIFFDCPPNFTALSYSTLNCSNLILIPVNPDVFAATGIGLMVEGLRGRIDPWPNPKLAVFMNKAKLRSGKPTRETSMYWTQSKERCQSLATEGIDILPLETLIPDRVDIKRAIPRGEFPKEFEPNLSALWDDVEKCLR